MQRTHWIAIAVFLLFTGSPSAETIHLKNGKSLEGRILSRENDRIWLDTETGRLPILLNRIEVPQSETLEEARTALKAGENQRALKLSEIVQFWNPDNEEAARLIELSRNQIELAAKGRELTEKGNEAQSVFDEIAARVKTIERSETDPGAEEMALLEIESDLKEAIQEFGDGLLGEEFEQLLKNVSEQTVSAHKRRLEKEAVETAKRDLEIQRMRAEAIGIRDFFAPVAMLNNGGKTLDLGLLMVPDGIMIFDFYADWCEPCKILDPLLRELAEKDDDVYLRRINILDYEKPIARQYNLDGIPSVWVYDGQGELVESGLYQIDGVQDAVRRARL